jgi:hypothetical protein
VELSWRLSFCSDCLSNATKEDIAAAQGTNGIILFEPGQALATLLVALANDDIPEDDESFHVVLSIVDASGLLSTSMIPFAEASEITILANDDYQGRPAMID